jgi:hypothetical protein
LARQEDQTPVAIADIAKAKNFGEIFRKYFCFCAIQVF